MIAAGRRPANAHATTLVDKGALGGYRPNDVLEADIDAIGHPTCDAAAAGLKPLSTVPAHSSAVIPEIDIWRAAQLMLKRYGDPALKESAARATELTLAGDDDGAATWHRIMAAVAELANTTPRGRSTDRERSIRAPLSNSE
jgi:hypothetical protein